MGDSQLIMDYGRVGAAGQAAGDVSTGLAMVNDQTAAGCTVAARANPAWATSQAVLTLHAAHSENIDGHIEAIRSTGNDILRSVDITQGADNASARDAETITTARE